MLRIEELKQALLNGQLHKAKQLCKLDFEPGRKIQVFGIWR